MMNKKYIEDIREFLFSKKDEGYKEFTAKIIPNIDRKSIIGVRTNILRKYARALSKDEEVDFFLKDLPHKYYEENQLHAFIVEREKDYPSLIKGLDDFLKYIDNWATCDSLSPVLFKKEKEKTKDYISKLLDSDKTYVKRFAIVSSLKFYLKEELDMDLFYKIMKIHSQEYYLNMAIAWYMSYVIIHHYDFSIKYLEENNLSDFVFSMSIRKALDSRQIDKDKKEELKRIRMQKNKS